MTNNQYEKDASSSKITKKQEVEYEEKHAQENICKQESQSYEYDNSKCNKYYKNSS